MKLAFTTKGKAWDSMMDPRFGRTEYFLIYDQEKDELSSYDNKSIEQQAHGAGPKTAQKLFEFGASVLITGNGPGGNAESILKSMNLKIYIGAGEMTVKEAYEAYKANELSEF